MFELKRGDVTKIYTRMLYIKFIHYTPLATIDMTFGNRAILTEVINS